MSRGELPRSLYGVAARYDGPYRATDEEIRQAFEDGATVSDIADWLCRSEGSIRSALRREREGRRSDGRR